MSTEITANDDNEGSMVDQVANPNQTDGYLVLLLRFSAFLCFLGWTWAHLYWEGPYGVLLWQDATYELAERFGISWDEFVGSGASDGFVQRWNYRIGWLYLACTVLTLTVHRRAYFQMAALVGGSGLLTILSFAKYVKAQYQLPMFVEHGGQMLTPILLVLALALGARHRITVATAMIAVIATFAGHGAYAIGWWPTPANFYAMTTVILGCDYETTVAMLRWAGILDFAVCLLILIPPIRRLAAGYAATWGLLTALARPVAGMSTSLNYYGADQYIHEAVLRAPHFLIPLYLIILWRPSSDRLGNDINH